MQKITDTNFKMREKKRWYIITSLSLIFLCVLLVIFSPENAKTEKQIMTIIVSIDDNNEQFVAHISEKGKKYTKKLLAINRNNVYDLTNIILLVKEYESNGWKTINSNMEIPTLKEKNKFYFYFFMQK
ncbi:MAG: hypothetical protein EAZ44_07530 [Cytophagia bacterium]|nr:MAG: hypothetical protein EAY69_07320 [Cytophagales bacterium]TAG02226.1 MAG: hypothetical protein EAZ44_07530 [Cytophagia bacterium]TAG41513.1 MAG: hypothetical protein EAZ31_07375 [Cytophagia bacterium]TAH28233.1 MAG: hypothetical protein EAZ06_10775 [Cytophagales bacterium]